MGFEILLFVALGIFTGLFAGMLGIGGGVFVVPGLFLIFSYFGFDKAYLIKYAIASSLSIMIFTAISSTFAHYKKNNILFEVIKKMALFVVIGTVLGAFFAHLLENKILSIIFAFFLLFVAIKMLFHFKIKKHRKKISNKILVFAGFLIGFKSGILGIGGGALSVPFLSYFNVSMKKASGTSAFITLIISSVGAVSFVLFGQNIIAAKPYFLGYVYLPALFSIAPMTMIFAPIGVKIAHVISDKTLKRLFGVLLLLLSAKMIFFDGLFS